MCVCVCVRVRVRVRACVCVCMECWSWTNEVAEWSQNLLSNYINNVLGNRTSENSRRMFIFRRESVHPINLTPGFVSLRD
jgi:hypothetical protein